jgi:hypothetical protein
MEELEKKEGRLDKFLGYYLKGKPLTPGQEEIRLRYEKVNNLLCKGWSRDGIVNFLNNEYGLKPSQAYQVIKDTITLFGDVNESNLKGLKHVLFENFMLNSRKARKYGDYASSTRALEGAAKIYHVFEKTVNTDELFEVFSFTIERTTDPKALEEIPTIDIPHEEIEEESPTD